VIGLDRLERLQRAVGDRAHHLDHVERRFGEVDLAAEQGDARAVLLRLENQLEAIAGGAGAAAEHADDQARVEGSELVERARPVVDDLEETRPLGLGQAGEAAHDAVVDEIRHDVGRDQPGVGIEDFEEVAEVAGRRVGAKNVEGLERSEIGVEVGKVKHISVKPDNTVLVEFTTDPSVVLTQGSRAAIRYDNQIGGRYLSLEQGVGSTQRINQGDTIPLTNTSPALDLDALIGGFRPLFRALDPNQVNALTGQLIKAFEGQGNTIQSFFAQTAALTNTLADRDQLIGQVIVNLNSVLGSLGDQNTQFAKAVDSLSQLVSTLAGRKQDISTTVAYTNAAAGSVADLLAQARPPTIKVIAETDRTGAAVLAEHDYVDNLLNTLPDAYRAINRQGMYGDFFSFYLCDIILKINGKGGQPVYIKLAGQSSGRCTPK